MVPPACREAAIVKRPATYPQRQKEGRERLTARDWQRIQKSRAEMKAKMEAYAKQAKVNKQKYASKKAGHQHSR